MSAHATSDNEGKKRLAFVRANRAAVIVISIGVILLVLGLAVAWTYSGRATRLFYDYPARYNRAYHDRVLEHQKIQKGFNPAVEPNKTLLNQETLSSVWSQQYNPPASRRDQTIANILGCVGVAGLLLVVAGLILMIDRKRRGKRESADAVAESHAPPSRQAPDEISGKRPRHRLRDFVGLCRRTFTSPQKALILIGLVFGILMLIVNPPFRASDEHVHYMKALSLSEGHVTSVVIHDRKNSGKVTGVGSYVNMSYVFLSSDIKFAPLDRKMSGKDIIDALSIPPDPAGAKRVFADYGFSGMAIHSPLLYIPQALGMLVGRMFRLSPLLLMYAGRFFNLLFFLILVYVSISIMPVLKWAMVFLALMPQTIFLAASLSADGPLLAYCFLAIAYFLFLALDAKKASIGRREIVVLLLLAALLGLAKPPYFLLVLLFLMIPLGKLRPRRDYFLVFALILVLAIVVCAGWTFLVKDASRTPSPTVKPSEQLHEIITHPLRLPHVIWTALTPLGKPSSEQMPNVQQFVGTVGWNGPVLPNWFGFCYLFALFFVSAIDKEDVRVNLLQKTVSLGTAILIWIVSLAIFYVFWTPLRLNAIAGVNARYMIPIAPLALLLFYNQKIRYEKGPEFYALAFGFIALSIIITIVTMITNCYA